MCLSVSASVNSAMARSSGRWARLSRAEADRGAEDEGEGKGGEKTRDEQRPAPPDREAGFRRALGHREADRDEAREAAEGGGGGRHQEDEETDRVEEAGEHRGDSGDEIIAVRDRAAGRLRGRRIAEHRGEGAARPRSAARRGGEGGDRTGKH